MTRLTEQADTKKEVLFIQGGGNDGYYADKKLVEALQTSLGNDYEFYYPQLQTDEALPDFGWLEQIGKEISALNDNAILAAHSLGASLLLKYLSENKVSKPIAGIFLIATPFWDGKEDWQQGLKLRDDFDKKLPKNIPMYFYHSLDDEEVPFKQLSVYEHKLPKAAFREIESGGHQLDKRISLVAEDIRAV